MESTGQPLQGSIREDARLIIRPMPKVVFFYMTWIASLGCALSLNGTNAHLLGLIWNGIFIFNLIVISFDFSEDRSLIAILGFGAAALLVVQWGMVEVVQGWFYALKPEMNAAFYWMMFGTFSIIFASVWVQTRVNYWVFRPNEVVHRYGFFGKVKRYRPELIRWDKVMPDVLERILLGTGTMILSTPQENEPIILEHVVGIGKKDNRISEILGTQGGPQATGMHAQAKVI